MVFGPFFWFSRVFWVFLPGFLGFLADFSEFCGFFGGFFEVFPGFLGFLAGFWVF